MSPFVELEQLDAEFVMPTYGRYPVAFVRGDGVRLWDSEGREYLDFLGGLAVTALGHAHPELTATVADQAARLWHVSNLYYNEHQPPLAATLDRLLGGGGQVFFANSGAEANECAIKLARRYGQLHGGPDRFHVVSAYGSFHGRTLTTLAATGQPQKQETFQPLPAGFRQVAFDEFAAYEQAVADPRVAAVIIEAVQGEGGVQSADPDLLRGLRGLCDEHEVLLILDEVQVGLGRTGQWFGFDAAGIRPDIVTLAKALGNGMPIGACWARTEVAQAFRPGDHATTYGGQPLAAAVARKVLEIMEREDAPALAAKAGATLSAALGTTPGIADVRGSGLLIAAELAPDVDAGAVARACLDAGLVVNAVTPTALRFAPSLLVTDAEIAAAVAVLAGVLTVAHPGARA